MSDWKLGIIEAMKEHLIAHHEHRIRPEGWQSVRRNWGPEYLAIAERDRAAKNKLWEITDMEYAEDGFRNFVWEWRYWSVMARKCCWSQRSGSTDWAAETMAKCGKAKLNFVKACGLEELYHSPHEYIEKMFPNLRTKPISSPSDDSPQSSKGG